MEMLVILTLFGVVRFTNAIRCDKVLNYHENYGYGSDITCEELSARNDKMLKNISVYNEIMLSIDRSNLTNITSDLFNNVQKLKYLTISNSTLTFFNETGFYNLDRLEHLSVVNTTFQISNNTFQRLSNLVELNLDNCSVNGRLHSSNSSLRSASNLSSLSSSSSLSSLSNKTLPISLKTLRLPRNSIKSLEDLPVCELKNLRILDVEHNHIESVKNVSCEPTKHLVELDLSSNRIYEFGILKLKSLKALDVSNNRLKIITGKLPLHLTTILLNNNSLVDTKAFDGLTSLKILELSSNKITKLTLINLPALEKLCLGRNRIRFFKLEALNLKTLELADNLLSGHLKPEVLNFPKLETLDLSNNAIVLQEDTFRHSTNLKQLLISNNSLKQLPVKIFANLTSLRILDLSANKLESIESGETFSSLTNLETLNMSFNQLEHLKYEVLSSLQNLQVLDIAGNKLQLFEYDLILALLPSLRIINIKSNDLACDYLYKIITFLKKKRVSYTINENFEYEKENVAGIYCSEKKAKEQGVSRTMVVLLATLIGLLLVGVFGCFKFIYYFKRRGYVIDEMELIEE